MGVLGGLAAYADHFHGMAYFQDVKTINVGGGSYTAGTWVTRDLNYPVFNAISGCSLSNNRITLPPGAYLLIGRAPAYLIAYHFARFYNYSDGAYIGQNGTKSRTTSASGDIHHAMAFAWLNLSASKEIELRHYGSATYATTGLGTPANYVVPEVYSEVVVLKIGER